MYPADAFTLLSDSQQNLKGCISYPSLLVSFLFPTHVCFQYVYLKSFSCSRLLGQVYHEALTALSSLAPEYKSVYYFRLTRNVIPFLYIALP